MSKNRTTTISAHIKEATVSLFYGIIAMITIYVVIAAGIVAFIWELSAWVIASAKPVPTTSPAYPSIEHTHQERFVGGNSFDV